MQNVRDSDAASDKARSVEVYQSFEIPFKQEMLNRDIFLQFRDALFSIAALGFAVTLEFFSFIPLTVFGQQAPQSLPASPVWRTDSSFPQHGQFYARGANNAAVIRLSGTLFRSDVDSVYVLLARNNTPYKRFALKIAQPVQKPVQKKIATHKLQRPDTAYRPQQKQLQNDSLSERRFLINFSIHAEWSVYSFKLGFKSRSWDSVVAVRDSIVCGDVIVLNGQSNIVLGNPIAVPDALGRTFWDTSGSIIPTGINAQMRDFVWLTTQEAYSKGFPVGGIGFRLQQQIHAHQKIPICILNGGVGATTIERHEPDTLNPASPETIYGNLLTRIQRSGLQTSVRTLIWYQGESNMDEVGYEKYFRSLYQAWMRDYPNLCKIYVVQIHASHCLELPHGPLKEKQRLLQDIFPNVEIVSSNAIPDHHGCHFGDSGYAALGDRIYRLLARDVYNSPYTSQLSSPTLRSASWLDSTKRKICLTFAPKGNNLTLTADTIIAGNQYTMNDSFLVGGQSGYIASAQPEGQDTLILTLKDSVPTVDYPHISYASQTFYLASTVVYQGPWIVNQRGVAALSFHDVPIQSAAAKK